MALSESDKRRKESLAYQIADMSEKKRQAALRYSRTIASLRKTVANLRERLKNSSKSSKDSIRASIKRTQACIASNVEMKRRDSERFSNVIAALRKSKASIK